MDWSGARHRSLPAYLTIDARPDPDTKKVLADSLAMVERGRELGFSMMKVETSLEQVRDEAMLPNFVRETRRVLGEEATLMLDVVYRWHDVKTALRSLDRMADADLRFVEAPFSNDHLDSYAQLATRTNVAVAAGEWLITRFEFIELMDQGLCDIVQPGVCRVGGFTEAMRIARLAEDRGRVVVPYGWWATGIGLAASLHFAAAVEHCPFVEYVHPAIYPSVLRERLVQPTMQPVDGHFTLPDRPGLGVELDEDIVRKWRVA